MPLHRRELIRLEKSAPDVVLRQHRDMRLGVQSARLDRQGEHPFQRGQLAIDFGR